MQCPGKITIHAGKKSFTGPERSNYRMPALPRSAIADRLVKFDMRLQDVPGLTAEPYPNSDWRIVRATSLKSALSSEEIILSGCSDDDGNIALQATEEKLLQEEYNKSPNALWVVANSHARELVIKSKNKNWSNADGFYHGLNALGYTDDYMSVNGSDVEDFFAKIARQELGTSSGMSLLKKINRNS